MSTVQLPALVVDNVALVAATPRLVLVNRDPCPNEQRVPVDSVVALELIDTGPAGVDRGATKVWLDDVLAFEGGGVPEVKPGFDGPLSVVTTTADTLRLVLHPTSLLPSLARIGVRVVSRTVDGLATVDETYSFDVEDRTAPRLVAAQAIAPKVVRVAFDEPVVVPAGSGFTVAPRGVPAVPVRVVATSVEDSLVLLSLDTEMTPDVEHEVSALGVTDASGNVVLGPYDRARFTGFRPARPPTRRFDLWRMLPKHNRRDDQTGDLLRFISCLQEVTDLLLADADRWQDIFDFERSPEGFVDLILRDLGNPFPFDLDALGKRRLASVLVEMYRQKGTAKGIRNAIRFFLGIDISAITPLNADTMFLGESLLGVDWTLGPSDRFARYAFNVEVARLLTDRERRQLRAIVEYLKPAHTHFVDLVEPLPPVIPDHWELGLSDLGDTSLLH